MNWGKQKCLCFFPTRLYSILLSAERPQTRSGKTYIYSAITNSRVVLIFFCHLTMPPRSDPADEERVSQRDASLTIRGKCLRGNAMQSGGTVISCWHLWRNSSSSSSGYCVAAPLFFFHAKSNHSHPFAVESNSAHGGLYFIFSPLPTTRQVIWVSSYDTEQRKRDIILFRTFRVVFHANLSSSK